MRIVVVGGAGAMGATACRTLAALEEVREVVVADRDVGAAERVASSISSCARVSPRAVDLLDPASARAALRDTDLVVNCAGPFFRLGVPTLRAAIEARVAYLDLCDDPQPTRAMFELDAEAKRAGVFAVVGMGASPGLSNLLVVRAAKHLDRLLDCYTVWPLDGAAAPGDDDLRSQAEKQGGPSAAAVHLMEQICGRIAVVEHGVVVERPPLEPVRLRYPGLGAGTAYTVGHPEPWTLSRSLALEGRAACLMLLKRSTAPFLQSLQRDLDGGVLTREAAAAELFVPSRRRVAAAVARSWFLRGPGNLPPFFVLLRGEKNGRRRTVGCHVTSLPRGMDGATAVPCALASRLLLQRPPAPGVHAPETAVDADDLLEALLSYCPAAVTSIDQLAPVVVDDMAGDR